VKIEEELKQDKFTSAVHKAIVNIMFTDGWLSNHLRDVFKDHNLTPQQYNVLRILRGKYPEALNPSDIKAVMLDKNPDLTRLCDRLLTRKLIDRCIDGDNRRKMNIRITEDGLKMLNLIDPIMIDFNEKVSTISEEEATILSNLLDKLRG
jgi:DNA-binding MarR family transcriptional regulator